MLVADLQPSRERAAVAVPALSSAAAPGVAVLNGLRVALVGPLAPPAGGMAGQTRQLADLLLGAGAQVRLIQTNRPYAPPWAARLRGMRALFRLLPYIAQLWRAAGQVQLFHVMANSGWAWHLFAAPAIVVAWMRGVPAVVNYRGGEAASFLSRQGPGVRVLMRRAAVLAVPSGFLHEVFKRHGMAAAVLPNIVDLSLYHPDTTRPQRAAHLVVTRNLEALYDNATALRAFAIVRRRRPDARLTIAGTGPEADALRRLAAELGLAGDVRFAGQLARAEVAELLRSADVWLNPSLADNMPNSLLEALAAGVPVVSTAVGGVPYLVEHERTALLVPAGSADAMAAAALRLLEEGDTRQRLVANGSAEVQRYTWPCVAPVLGSLYSQALGRPA